MNKFLTKIVCLSLTSFYFFKVEQVQSLVPYYYLPTIKNLQKESLSIGKMHTNFYILDNMSKA